MNYAVILAGGVGSRFWPISTLNTPKQILNITGKYTPLQNTIKRISGLIKPSNILIITNELLEKEIQNQVKILRIPKENILVEPCRKNTALPIAWVADILYKKDSASTMIVLPADHFINDKNNFLNSIKTAIKFAQSNLLVTLGIKPNCPETAYGYIQIKSKVKNNPEKSRGFPGLSPRNFVEIPEGKAKINSYIVEKFYEKPNLKKAKKLIENKNCYWNSGIFIWKTKTILEEFQRYLPDISLGLNKVKNKNEFSDFWGKCESISIDYGILEKSKRMILVPANFNWQDIGSWDALDKVIKPNKQNNVIHAKSLNLDSSNLIIWSDDRLQTKKLIATVGLKDLIIVESKDAILICHKNNAQDVKKIAAICNHQSAI